MHTVNRRLECATCHQGIYTTKCACDWCGAETTEEGSFTLPKGWVEIDDMEQSDMLLMCDSCWEKFKP